MRISSTILASAIVLLAASDAYAARPYVVLQDDGTIESVNFQTHTGDPSKIVPKLLELYDATGLPRPEMLSVWSTFPFAGESNATYFLVQGNDIKGTGLDTMYKALVGGDGTFDSMNPPLRSIMFHNDVNALPARAALLGAPEEGFASYLFLLELSHDWGCAIQVPGAEPTKLWAYPNANPPDGIHWSYWMDAGGSPAGGNAWKDNGDGTFSTLPQTPGAMHFSKVDQYIMGLLPAADVPPFGVLENAVPPADIQDPYTKKAYARGSFPWFGSTPMKVTATRREPTIDDVVTTNGPRIPAAGEAPTSWKLGIVLLTSSKDTPDTVKAATAIFDPIAASLAPSFHSATDDLGTLDVVTSSPDESGAGGGAGAGGAGAGGVLTTGATASTAGGGSTKAEGTEGDGGCQMSPSRSGGGALGLLVAGLAFVASRRRKARGR